MSDDREEFSVYQFFADGSCERVLAYVGIKEAVGCAHGLVNSVGGRNGIVRRVIITTGGDETAFDWRHGEGIVTPDIEGAHPG